jgi:DNA-binding transcriptional MerR regulator
MTLRTWRIEGLLPLTRNDGPSLYHYNSSDVDRVLAAQSEGSCVRLDHRAVRRQLGLDDTAEIPPPANRLRLRPLPTGLVTALQTARQYERDAADAHARREAIAATVALIRGLFDLEWRNKEVAAAIGIDPRTIDHRIRVAKARGEPPAKLSPDLAPAEPPDGHFPFPRTPIEQRDGLTLNEAAAYAGCSLQTIANWRNAGLLPNTDETTYPNRVYSRTDIGKVLTAPRNGGGRFTIAAHCISAREAPTSRARRPYFRPGCHGLGGACTCRSCSARPLTSSTPASPEVYKLLVLDRGWALERYETWLTDALVNQLLAAPPGA